MPILKVRLDYLDCFKCCDTVKLAKTPTIEFINVWCLLTDCLLPFAPVWIAFGTKDLEEFNKTMTISFTNIEC